MRQYSVLFKHRYESFATKGPSFLIFHTNLTQYVVPRTLTAPYEQLTGLIRKLSVMDHGICRTERRGFLVNGIGPFSTNVEHGPREDTSTSVATFQINDT